MINDKTIYDNYHYVSSLRKTEYMMRNSLDLLSGSYKFEFCLVNMTDMERRLREKELNLLSVLSEKEMDHFHSLKINKNKIQWAAGRYAVKAALFKYKMSESSLVNPSCIDVLKGRDSAPYILQYPDLCASITHSFPYCIGMVSSNRIGVDLEKAVVPEPSLIEHFYSRNEKDALKGLKGAEEYAKRAMEYWTRKEAASKVVRLGMKLNFKRLDTSRDKVVIDNCCIRVKSVVCREFCLSIAFEEKVD
ncbi:MAG TPA: 4'-phosphopantetheinyl transferase superfamily protein [Pseudobacteroides sp.]|uniref:4'-phosphopantetheinyl transferase family protein n=1 Tax=Pseudobacteroides sp. TaxID=1968840 RepID=UPI002F922F53